MKTKDERLADLEELLKGVAVLILETVEPDAAEAVHAARNQREVKEAHAEIVHGPYCREVDYIMPQGDGDAGIWVYCGRKKDHTGPCDYVRAIGTEAKPLCDKATWMKPRDEPKAAWVYCGNPAGHAGKCNMVRVVKE